MSTPIRVTEVLNYFKEPWYIDWIHRVGRTEANRVSKAAMKIGTRVDEIIKENPLNPDASQHKKETNEVLVAMGAYQKWLEVYKPKSITPCTRLNATIDGVEVTGEPDLMVDDVLVDIKCSSKISPSYWIQVNMYNLLRERHLPQPYWASEHKVGILRLDKVTGSYEYVVKDYDQKLVDVWCGLMRAFVYYKGVGNDGVDI